VSHDEAVLIRQAFNKAGDQAGTTISDDTQLQDVPPPDMLDAFATGIFGDVSPGLSPFERWQRKCEVSTLAVLYESPLAEV